MMGPDILSERAMSLCAHVHRAKRAQIIDIIVNVAHLVGKEREKMHAATAEYPHRERSGPERKEAPAVLHRRLHPTADHRLGKSRWKGSQKS